jgi:PPOX class probable F420-dependent enzyme
MMLDEGTEFGRRAARRLRDERLAWLTTVSPQGGPHPVLVWFLWDGESSALLYSRPETPKLRNIAANPRVTLHLDGNGEGGDVVVCVGRASVSDDAPADGIPAYVEKYAALIDRNRWTPASFAADYSVPVRIAFSRIRGH